MLHSLCQRFIANTTKDNSDSTYMVAVAAMGNNVRGKTSSFFFVPGLNTCDKLSCIVATLHANPPA